MVLMAKKLPANAGDTGDKGLIPGSEDILEEGIATHSSILAWRAPWTEEPSRVSIGSQKSQIPSKRLGTLRRKTENWLSAWRRTVCNWQHGDGEGIRKRCTQSGGDDQAGD